MSDERAKFEAWDREIYALPGYCYGSYKDGFSHLAVEARWQAWQAAKAQVSPPADESADPMKAPLAFDDWWKFVSKVPYRSKEELARMAWHAAMAKGD